MVDADAIERLFESAPIAGMDTYQQLVTGRRLRFADEHIESCDLVDDYSTRLICESISTGRSALVIWPDAQPRRAPLAFAASVISDSTRGLGNEGSRIVYVGHDASIREQLQRVSIGSTSLGSIFAQEFRRGADVRRTGPYSSLPIVTSVLSPADPSLMVRKLSPRWIAVDCSGARSPRWLPSLLAAGRQRGIPVVGWTDSHLSDVARTWMEHSATVLRWPAHVGSEALASLDFVKHESFIAEIRPCVVGDEASAECVGHLVDAYRGLARASQYSGRLRRDALSLAWRYLRLLETLPVPISLYEAECTRHWGMSPLSKLRQSLNKFVEALRSDSDFSQLIAAAATSLQIAHDQLSASDEPPLWKAAATRAIDADEPLRLLFGSRAMCQMFRFALLSYFNVSDRDLEHVGVWTSRLADAARHSDGMPELGDTECLLVGMPSRINDAHLEAVMMHADVGVLIWPHLLLSLERRAQEWDSQLRFALLGSTPFGTLPDANGSAAASATSRVVIGDSSPAVRSSERPPSSIATHVGTEGPALWSEPDLADAIGSLFTQDDGDWESYAESCRSTDADGDETDAQGEWVEEALCLTFDDGHSMLLPNDARLNVIVESHRGATIEPRFVSAIRPGDSLVIVDGDHRRDLYDLLVSRVHRHRVISQYLLLIERWHSELQSAFRFAQTNGLTIQELFHSLQAAGTGVTSAAAVRGWVSGSVLSPNDADDVKRLGDILDVPIAKQYSRQIRTAAGRLKGLHINLSTRLNRWLSSDQPGAAATRPGSDVVDEELGLTFDDFRHSLLRVRVVTVERRSGPFLRSHLGQINGASE